MNNVREEFINILHDVDWMDDGTRNEAIEKAKGIISHIAYPDELTDNNKLEEYYSGLELQSDQLLKNVLQIRTFKEVHAIQKLRLPVNKTDWETHTMPATVNAAYSPLENSIRKLKFGPINHLNNTNYIQIFQISFLAGRIARSNFARSLLFG